MSADFAHILSAWGPLDDGQGPVAAASLPVAVLSGGLINGTWSLGKRHILQRLHPIFRPTVNRDIAALTPILDQAGVPVPRLVPTASGLPCHIQTGPEGTDISWRILTRLAGQSQHKLHSTAQAERAGAMVGRFHGALLHAQHEFAFTRAGAHNTQLHMDNLSRAVADRADHPLAAQVRVLAADLLDRWRAWGPVPTLPRRLIHGDLKVSNLLFDGDLVCGVIDLDTMAWSSLDVELGDALRSWCNPTSEDDPHPHFDVAVFASAWAGYLSTAGSWLTAAERTAVVAAVERICLELSARFAADVLLDCYFGWDNQRFSSRSEHNWVRARNQWLLAKDVASQRPALERLLRETAGLV